MGSVFHRTPKQVPIKSEILVPALLIVFWCRMMMQLAPNNHKVLEGGGGVGGGGVGGASGLFRKLRSNVILWSFCVRTVQ